MRVDAAEIAFRERFGQRLDMVIKKRGLSREETAKLTGVGETTIYKYCNAEVFATLHKAYLLARGLGVSMDWLVGFKRDCEYDEVDPGWVCKRCAYYAEGEGVGGYQYCPGCGAKIRCKNPRI